MRSFGIVLLAIANFGWSACKKSEEPAHVITLYGIISGNIYPLISQDINIVSILNLQTNSLRTFKPDTNGGFWIEGLPVGDYRVSIMTGSSAFPVSSVETTVYESRLSSVNFNIGSSISGSVSPVTGGSYVTVTDGLGSYIPSSGIDASGNFLISGLRQGSYKVVVTPVWGFTPADTTTRRVTIEYMKPANAGVFSMTGSPDPVPPNTISFDLDGVTIPGFGSARSSYVTPNFSISSSKTTPLPSGQIGYTILDGLGIILDSVTGPGTYVCKGTSTSMIKLTHSNSSWSTSGAGGSGTVTITSIDPVRRLLAGTFSGVLVPATAATTGTRIIANGTFSKFVY